MAWTLKLVIMLKKCAVPTNSVTNSVISFDIMFKWLRKIWHILDWLVEFAAFPEYNCSSLFFFFISCCNIISSLTSIFDKRTARSRASTKALYFLLKIKFSSLQTILGHEFSRVWRILIVFGKINIREVFQNNHIAKINVRENIFCPFFLSYISYKNK